MFKTAEKVNKGNFKVDSHQLAATFTTSVQWSNFVLKVCSFLTYDCYMRFLLL